MGGFFVGSRISVPVFISEIGAISWPENAFIVSWAFVQVTQMNILQVWQKEVAFASLEQL